MAKFIRLSYNLGMKKIFLTILALGLVGGVSAQAALPWKKEVQEEVIDATSQQAKVLYAQNEIDEALKLLKSKGEDLRSTEDWLLIGNILQDKDRIDEATYMFKKSIDKNPKYYKAHYNLGYIYLIQDKPNMALDEFKKAVKYKERQADVPARSCVRTPASAPALHRCVPAPRGDPTDPAKAHPPAG